MDRSPFDPDVHLLDPTRIGAFLIVFSAILLPRSAGAQVVASPTGTAVDSVTLDQALKLALNVRPGIVDAMGQLGNAEIGVRAAYGAFLPSLSASASGGAFYSQVPVPDPVTHQLTGVGDQTSGSVSFGLNVSLDLFTGFRRGKLVSAARLDQDAARANLKAAEAQARLDVANAFYGALNAAQLVESRRDRLNRAESQLRIAIARQTTGGATVSDSLRAFVQLGEAQLNLLTAESQQAAAELTLAQVIGRPGRAVARDDPQFHSPSTILDTAALGAQAITLAPTVASADAQAAAARAQLAAARSGYWPTLSLGGGVAYAGAANANPLFQSRQLALSLNVPIFSQFRQQQLVQQSVAVWASAEARAADIRRTVSVQVASQVAALRTAAEQMRITTLSAEAARADLRVQLERYRLGSATTLDVLNSQSSVSQNDEGALNARFNYLRSRAQLEALVGHPL